VCPAHLYWATFVSAIKNQFLSSLEGQEAKNQIDAERYSGDIEDYLVKMKRLNNLVGMFRVTLRSTIERQLPKDLRRRISLMPNTDLDDEWIQRVVKAGKMEKSFLAEEKLLRGLHDKP
jgi:cell division inhibitor SulA